MGQNAYHEIYLHLVWRTKNSAALLRGNIESTAHEHIRSRIMKTDGVYIDGLGGTDDHIHLAIHIAPTITISEFIGDVKGAVSHKINKSLRQKLLYWQSGYGVVSFGKKNLSYVLDYIRNQREHHAKGKVIERLERDDCELE